MIYCIRCLQPDTRPNTKFVNHLCPACNFVANSASDAWNDRLKSTRRQIEKYRVVEGAYDAVLGVSGGKDSIKLAMWARDFLGLKILLVTVGYPPEQVTKRGTQNLSRLAELGFDVHSILPSPIIWKELMKIGFLNYGNWAKSTEMALFAGVPQVAIALRIPLILWGENPGVQLGDLATSKSEGWDGNNLRFLNTISGGLEAFSKISGFSKRELQPYMYPTEQEFTDKNIQIIYLGWAMNNWGLLENGLFSSLLNLKARTDLPMNTQDLLKISSLDEDWVTLNQMIKYYKYGFGRATDYVNEWIRTGRLSREQGIEIVEEFDGACSDTYIQSFCDFLEISTIQFWETVKRFTNTRLFDNSAQPRPLKRFQVGHGIK